jgi:hypothetical protein
MFRKALATLVASLAACLSIDGTAAASAPAQGGLPAAAETQPAKAKNLYFAYKVKITNGVP